MDKTSIRATETRTGDIACVWGTQVVQRVSSLEMRSGFQEKDGKKELDAA